MSEKMRRTKTGSRASRAVIRQAIESLESRTMLAVNAAPTAPTAQLSAPVHEKWLSTYTFKVIYRDVNGIDVSTIDSQDLKITGPNGYVTKARFISATPTDKSNTVVTGRYKMSTPGPMWDAADNGSYNVKLYRSQVADVTGTFAVSKNLGAIKINVPDLPSEEGGSIDSPPGALDVRNFGAVANDAGDDTSAIQAAIDSLPRGNAVPTADSPIGGIVYIPAGTYMLSRPLRVSSGVVLEGQGATSILNNTSGDTKSGAIELVSYTGNGAVVHTAVRDLNIITSRAKGISTPGINGDIVGLELTGLTISTGAGAIDLRGENVYQSTLRDITIHDPGSTAIWMEVGSVGGNTAVNRLENVVVDGTARSGFLGEKGMVVLVGDFTVDGLRVAETGAPVSALYAGAAISMRNISLDTAASSLPGGVLATFDSAVTMSIDSLTNISGSRSIKLKNAWDVQIDSVSLASGATLADSTNIDSSSHLSVEMLSGVVGSVRSERVRVGGSVVPPASNGGGGTSRGASNSKDPGPSSGIIVNATSFGAIPNDNNDDTAAIQAAIDSLPRGNGVPGDAANPVGGLVWLQHGTFNTSSALRLPSGVWLQGQGDGTIIKNHSGDVSSAAVLLVPGASAGTNVAAGVSSLAIKTNNAAGVRSDASVNSGLIDLTLNNLTISAGGVGIDLRATKTYHATIRTIGIASPGSTAIWVGDDAGYSADNSIVGVQVYGATRGGFRAEKALFVFQGQNKIQNLWIEQASANVLPLYVSGTADIRGTWLEYPPQHIPNAVTAKFERANVTIDRLLQIDDLHKIQLANATANISMMSIAGRLNTLADAVVLDSNSKLNINTVVAMRDVGMLDDPRVQIAGTFNQTNRSYVNTDDVTQKPNLLAPMSTWAVQWGDAIGRAGGTSTIEQTPDGPRLRIDITSNPSSRPVAIAINVNSANAGGKATTLGYRIDGPGTALIYSTGLQSQYTSRVMNSKTAVASPVALKGSGDQIIVVLPAQTGTFYLSGFSLVAND